MCFCCEDAVKTGQIGVFSTTSQVFLGCFTACNSKIRRVEPNFRISQGETKMSAKTNLALDITIFTAFLAVANPYLTGMTVHEWLALAFAAAIVTHLLFHWNWLVTVTKQFFKKLFHQSRLNYVVDVAFFVAMTTSFFSGLLISRSVMSTLGIQLNAGHDRESIHRLASDASLIMLGLHSALHIKWVVTNLKRYLVSPVIRLFQRPRTGALAPQFVHAKSGDFAIPPNTKE
jgi:hypothetical protein